MSAPARPRAAAAVWRPAEGLSVRGLVALLPGRGEHPGVYERFGRRLAADGYEVLVLDVPADQDVERTAAEVARALGDAPAPVVLAGSDTGALHALAVAARPGARVDALLLAGTPADDPQGTEVTDWQGELAARTACPAHRGRLDADQRFVRGGLARPVPAALARAAAEATPEDLPALVVHGGADPVTPLPAARRLASRLPRARLATVVDGRHDVLNDLAHRSVAATVVQWLESLRAGPHLPPAVTVEDTPFSP